jgi:hypothetical protein
VGKWIETGARRARRIDAETGAGRGQEQVEAGGLEEDGPALAGLRAGFSRFGTFQVRKFFDGPSISGMQAGFSRFGILQEKFVDLGANWKRKSMISREIRGIGARKFVAM